MGHRRQRLGPEGDFFPVFLQRFSTRQWIPNRTSSQRSSISEIPSDFWSMSPFCRRKWTRPARKEEGVEKEGKGNEKEGEEPCLSEFFVQVWRPGRSSTLCFLVIHLLIIVDEEGLGELDDFDGDIQTIWRWCRQNFGPLVFFFRERSTW